MEDKKKQQTKISSKKLQEKLTRLQKEIQDLTFRIERIKEQEKLENLNSKLEEWHKITPEERKIRQQEFSEIEWIDPNNGDEKASEQEIFQANLLINVIERKKAQKRLETQEPNLRGCFNLTPEERNIPQEEFSSGVDMSPLRKLADELEKNRTEWFAPDESDFDVATWTPEEKEKRYEGLRKIVESIEAKADAREKEELAEKSDKTADFAKPLETEVKNAPIKWALEEKKERNLYFTKFARSKTKVRKNYKLKKGNKLTPEGKSEK